MDRRLNRITRRNSRIMKCDKRNSKLERFEETVDGVMDWIYDAELFVSSAVEGTYEAVRERTHRLEVMLVFWPLFCSYVCFLLGCERTVDRR